MPIHPSMAEDLAAGTRDLYDEAERRLLGIIARQLAADLDTPQWAERKLSAIQALRRASQAVVDELGRAVTMEVHDAVAQSYNIGNRAAVSEFGALSDEARALVDSLVPNAADADRLAQTTVDVVTAPHRSILRTITDRFRSVVSRVAAFPLFGFSTRREATQDAMQRWADEGIHSFTDVSGRRWKLTSYAEMAVRTATGRAAVEGHMQALTTAGIDLVVVSDAPRECHLCRPYEGKVLSIGGPDTPAEVEVEHAIEDGVMVTVPVFGNLESARAAGFQHPNCRHSVSAYTPGVTRIGEATSDPEGYKAGQRQRAIERAIRKYKARQAAAVAPAAQRAAGAKVRQWQGAMRAHLAAHPDLQRIRQREQIGAGNAPGPGQVPPAPEFVEAARIRSGDERTPAEMTDEQLLAAVRSDQLDERALARVKAETDRRQVAALLDRIRPAGRLADDLTGFGDAELERAFPYLSDAEVLRVMAEMDRRDIFRRLPGYRPELVGMSDEELAARGRDADAGTLADLAAEAHRRDMLTRFFPGGNLSDDLSGLGEDDLAWCMRYGTPGEVARIADEMDRRDAVELPQPADSGDAVEDLLTDRAALADTMSPAPDVDEWGQWADEPDQPDAAPDDAAWDEEDQPEEQRRITRREARELYDEYVYAQYMNAEDATRGQMLNQAARAANMNPIILFSGPARIAYAHASDELKDWWASNGRMTQAEFIEKATGVRSSAADRARINEAEQQNRR